jgi:hypothetical protein
MVKNLSLRKRIITTGNFQSTAVISKHISKQKTKKKKTTYLCAGCVCSPWKEIFKQSLTSGAAQIWVWEADTLSSAVFSF